MFNENWLSEIKVIIFDMDGTLYQEDTYLERYIRYLISPYSSSDPESWNLRLTTLEELEQLMRAIQESTTRRTLTDGEDRAEAYQQEIQR